MNTELLKKYSMKLMWLIKKYSTQKLRFCSVLKIKPPLLTRLSVNLEIASTSSNILKKTKRRIIEIFFLNHFEYNKWNLSYHHSRGLTLKCPNLTVKILKIIVWESSESAGVKAKTNLNYAPINRSSISQSSGNFRLPLSTDLQAYTLNRETVNFISISFNFLSVRFGHFDDANSSVTSMHFGAINGPTPF